MLESTLPSARKKKFLSSPYLKTVNYSSVKTADLFLLSFKLLVPKFVTFSCESCLHLFPPTPIRQLKENNPEQQIQFKELAFLHSLSCVKIQNSSVSFPIFLGEFHFVMCVGEIEKEERKSSNEHFVIFY